METKLSDARAALKYTISQLEEVVPATKLDEPMTLHAITPHMQVLETSFGREVGDLGVSTELELTRDDSCGLRAFMLYITGQWYGFVFALVCIGLTFSEGTRDCWRVGSCRLPFCSFAVSRRLDNFDLPRRISNCKRILVSLPRHCCTMKRAPRRQRPKYNGLCFGSCHVM
jgi:hypothetical protein